MTSPFLATKMIFFDSLLMLNKMFVLSRERKINETRSIPPDFEFKNL